MILSYHPSATSVGLVSSFLSLFLLVTFLPHQLWAARRYCGFGSYREFHVATLVCLVGKCTRRRVTLASELPTMRLRGEVWSPDGDSGNTCSYRAGGNGAVPIFYSCAFSRFRRIRYSSWWGMSSSCISGDSPSFLRRIPPPHWRSSCELLRIRRI